MAESGRVAAFQLEGADDTHYCLAPDLPLLETIQRGEIPHSWQPLENSSLHEITFLSPLEYVSARQRALKLFDFDYIWEIYKPARQRKYGPYTLPILYGDQLVARMDARLDRPNQTLIINGFWLESWFEPNEDFAAAFASSLARFTNFLNANRLNSTILKPNFLRQKVDKEFAHN
jgi:uncharacterized protein YcaQ